MTNEWIGAAIRHIQKKVPHPHYRNTLAELFAVLNCVSAGEVIALVGASRTGKSALVAEVRRLILGPASTSIAEMPFISMIARNMSTAGHFSTKAFKAHALQVLQHPIYSRRPDDPWSASYEARMRNVTEGTLDLALECAVHARRTKWIHLGEMQHAMYATGGKKAVAAIMDSIKGFCEATGTTLIMSGTYPLLELMSLSPHLLGRSHMVHMPRYIQSKQEDWLHFNQILATWSQPMCVSGASALTDWAPLLYEGSLGCIGLLSKWLRRTLAGMQASGAEAITEELLLKSLTGLPDRTTIVEEIERGEELLERNAELAEACKTLRREDLVPPPASATKRNSRPFQHGPQRFPLNGRNSNHGHG